MYRDYFLAAAKFLTGKGFLPCIALDEPESEEALQRMEGRMGCPIPAELRDFYLEMGGSFSFHVDYEVLGFYVEEPIGLYTQSDFQKDLEEEVESHRQSEHCLNPLEQVRAEAERRANWVPFIDGSGGYWLCLDPSREPNPVVYHEIVSWANNPIETWNFELAPSFSELVRQWSRFCFSQPGTDIVAFCYDRTEKFDWSPEHFDPKYDRGSIEP